MSWLKIHRDMRNWEWYSHLPTRVLFMHLLMRVEYKSGTWRGISLEAGQTCTGRKELAIETGLSERQVRDALNNLQKSSDVAIKTTRKYSIITITNWEEYQGSGQQSASKPTSKAPLSKKYINNIILPREVSEELWADFEEHRNKLRKPMTNAARTAIFKKIETFRQQGFSPHDLLTTAIERGWLSVFLPEKRNEGSKQNNRGHGYKSKSERADDALSEFLAEQGIHPATNGAVGTNCSPELRHLADLREGSGSPEEHDASVQR